MIDATLEPPRWIGGPPICEKENLPAFLTLEALKAFALSIRMEDNIFRTWKCDFCKHYHAEFIPKERSGATSGSTKIRDRRLESHHKIGRP